MRDQSLLLFFGALFAMLLVIAPGTGFWIQGLFREDISEEVHRLQIENVSLKARLAEVEDLPAYPGEGIPARVFVRYPFNFKQSILVGAGSADGVEAGMKVAVPALMASSTSRTVLLGRVEQVFEHSSLVTTIYDSRFQMGVRIGVSGTESLLVGGSRPKLTLIPKDAKIQTGDPVYAASEGYPYGLGLGTVDTLSSASGGLLQEAMLEMPYDINAVHYVLIIK